MISLTIKQRDLLNELLNTNKPMVVADIAEQLQLTPRQVNYRLKPIKTWLAQYNAVLKTTPGVGIMIECSQSQRLSLLKQLASQNNFQLVLTSGQRQQLFVANLLTASEPFILNKLQYSAAVSRTTILKDLDIIETWTNSFSLKLIRRPNYGLYLEGSEMNRRQALTALLWGDTPFDDPITTMTYHDGLVFFLAKDAAQLPIIEEFNQLLQQMDVQNALNWVSYAESQEGGRFTDNALLHLVLVLSIQKYRTETGHFVACDADTLSWLTLQKVWQVSVEVSQKIWPNQEIDLLNCETATIAMHLLAGLRDEVWPGDLYIEPKLTGLITMLMNEVSQAFSTPSMRDDSSLRDGLVAHIIPAVMRQRFKLWAPPSWSDGKLSHQYSHEHYIAQVLATIVNEETEVQLPPGEVDTLTLLLRAAFIRERPHQPKRVLIVCSSGMATSQLLVARLKARFASLEIVGVFSLREISSREIARADLLISTIPTQQLPKTNIPIIQVHPLLLPENIETIAYWLSATVR